ncbi:SPOSA6832_00899, partial [Sporobolomyces salmonicolor]
MQLSKPALILDNGGHSIKATFASPSTPSSSADLPPFVSASLSPSLLSLLADHLSARPGSRVSVYRNAIIRSKTEKKTYVADEWDACKDFGGLSFRVPMERGILNNWEIEKTVWDRVFGHKGRGLKVNPHNTPLVVTEPVLNLPNVQEHYDQIVFEEYEFDSYLRVPGKQQLSQHRSLTFRLKQSAPGPALLPFGLDARGGPNELAPECALIVDAGFSFTHVVPVLRGAIISSGVRRRVSHPLEIDVGGKLLTNYLKELVSYRHWYMMDQTSTMEHAKEEACYVTTQWNEDWEAANANNNHIVRTYVLPDFTPTSTNKLGYVRTGLTPPPPSPPPVDPAAPYKAQAPPQDEEQLLYLCNERFTVPEVLFNPSTIDLNQAGLAETIAVSIASLPAELQGMFWNNIVCVGGSVGFEGFGARLPTTATVRSMSAALSSQQGQAFTLPPLAESFVSRQEYQEGGSNACRRKFGRFYWAGSKALEAELAAG